MPCRVCLPVTLADGIGGVPTQLLFDSIDLFLLTKDELTKLRLSSFGTQAEQHRLLAEHLTAESRRPRPVAGAPSKNETSGSNGVDNHWFDCFVGCAVAASCLV